MSVPAPTPLAERGIFGFLRPGLNDGPQRARVITAAALLMLAWMAVLAYLGPYVGSQLVRAVGAVAPRNMLIASTVTALGLSALIAWARGATALTLLAAMLLAYVGGTALSSFGFGWVASTGAAGWSRFALERSVYLVGVAIPCTVVYLIGKRRWPHAALGIGSWRRPTRFLTDGEKPYSWAQGLAGLTLTAGLPFFLVMQVAADFEPIRSGQFAGLLGPVVGLSFVNATAEEVIFRGFLQPAVIGAVGVGRGLWLQGVFFGIHHLGMSVSLLAMLPGALFVAIGSVVFGKSVVETRGLAWAIAAHMVFDIGVFAAFGAEIVS